MNTDNMKSPQRSSIKNIHKKIFYTQLILIVTLALFLGISGTLININFEIQKRDQNLQNIAEAIANSPLLDDKISNPQNDKIRVNFTQYLDTLKVTLDNIDVISVVSKDNVRLYHSNHSLIGTRYDGSLPEFEKTNKQYYTVNETGPSGSQRRAYAAVYDDNGNYTGFVMTIMLLKNVKSETFQILLMFALITFAAVLTELLVSAELSNTIKKNLYGYEPDVFSAMYRIRDNILESLNEGVLAVDAEARVQFANHSAVEILGKQKMKDVIGYPLSDICDDTFLANVLKKGEKKFNIQEKSLNNTNILIDCIPITEGGVPVGAAVILHDREEYTKLMEDLAGTRYLVDSMRANNHDFTNKLHVILGLIQMQMYDEAVSYIENISIVQRAAISRIMSAVDDPSIAALLIGKTARASELNIKFIPDEKNHYCKTDVSVPSEVMITIIGNLIDNACEAMNISGENRNAPKELRFGIYSRPKAVLITVDDTGVGISEENVKKIFEKGFSTKGEGRGTGLYQVKDLVEGYNGKITVESREGVGASFAVSFNMENQ